MLALLTQIRKTAFGDTFFDISAADNKIRNADDSRSPESTFFLRTHKLSLVFNCPTFSNCNVMQCKVLIRITLTFSYHTCSHLYSIYYYLSSHYFSFQSSNHILSLSISLWPPKPLDIYFPCTLASIFYIFHLQLPQSMQQQLAQLAQSMFVSSSSCSSWSGGKKNNTHTLAITHLSPPPTFLHRLCCHVLHLIGGLKLEANVRDCFELIVRGS